MRFWLKSEVKA